MTQEEYNEAQRKLSNELDQLEASTPEEDLAKRFFKNFGCINFRDDEFFHELNLARMFHARHMKRHPEAHPGGIVETTPYTCYHQFTCACGFKEAYDSGD